MNAYTNKPRTISFKDRASFRLAALFCITFLTFFIGWMAYDVFSSMMETNAAEAKLPNQPTVIQIDPKIETDLAKVLASDELPETASVSDPFNDKSGISGLTKTTAVLTASPPSRQTESGATQTVKNDGQAQRDSSRQTVAGLNSGRRNDYVFPNQVQPEDTKTRFTTWQQTGRFSGTGEPEPQIFAIEDLIPVGVVSGGDQKQEVIFYSQAADRTLSFPVGTRFYDAWLMEVRADGVVFTFDDIYRTSRLKSWGRSVKSNNSGE